MSYPLSGGNSLRRTKAQQAAWYLGYLFLLVGALGFIPGITSNYDDLYFAGSTSEAALLGVFQVSILHNIIHLAYGILGLLMARTHNAARAYLIGGGTVYLLLFVYGVIVPHHSSANFVPVNTADNWLHLVLGAGMLGLGLVFGRSAAPGRSARA